MNATTASVLVSISTGVGGTIGVLITWLRGRRADTVDLMQQWERSYGALLARVGELQSQLAHESEARLALEGRMSRALARIDHLEHLLAEADIPFNGPTV